MNSMYRPLYGNPANLDADSGDVEIASTDDTDIGMSDMEIDDNSDVDVDLDFEEVYQTSDVDNALQAVYQRMNLLDHDLGNTLLSAVTVRGGELERDIELDEITQSLDLFNRLAFPDYIPEELVAIVGLVTYDDETLDMDNVLFNEAVAMLTQENRNDYIFSDRANSIILARFGEEAAARHSELALLSPEERVAAFDQAGQILANMLGINEADWTQFVLDAFDNQIADDLEYEGDIFKDALKDTFNAVDSAEDPALHTQAPARRISAPAKTEMTSGTPATTTDKVIGSVAIGSALVGCFYLIKKLRG